MNPSFLDSLDWAIWKAVVIVVFAFCILMYLAWVGTKGSSNKDRNRLTAGRVRRAASMLVRTAISLVAKNNNHSVPMPTLQGGPAEPDI